MSDKRLRNVCIVLLVLLPMVLVMLFETGTITPEQTGLVTGVRISSTDNNNIQLIEKGTRFLSGPYEIYSSLPRTVREYGSRFSFSCWFAERVKVNGSWIDFEHGPFDISFTRGWGYSRVIELNYNNVTLTELIS